MANYFVQNFGPVICSLLPMPVWHRLCNIDLIIPHWHVVSDHPLEHISGIYNYRNLRQFHADLEFFLKQYKPIELKDIINHLECSNPLPKRCFLPTFDDGFRENYEVIAPILRSYGIPAVFFPIVSTIDNEELCYPQKKSLLIRKLMSQKSSSVEREVSKRLSNAGIKSDEAISQIEGVYYTNRHVLDELASIVGCDFGHYVKTIKPYMTSQQIATLIQNGFAIGAHSMDHPLYSELSIDEQVMQTKNSLRTLSERFQYLCNTFAFPYTDADISPDFFQRIFAESDLKITFGIGGIKRHYFSRHLPRFSMERTNRPARQILARQFGKAISGR